MAALSSELVDLHIMKVLYYRPTEGIVLRSQVINSLLYFAQRKGNIYIVKPFNHEMRRGMPNKSLRLLEKASLKNQFLFEFCQIVKVGARG